MKQAVAALGEEEVARLVREEGKIEVTCQFCNDTYHFNESEIADAREFAQKVDAAKEEGKVETAARFESDLEEVQVPLTLRARRVLLPATLHTSATAARPALVLEQHPSHPPVSLQRSSRSSRVLV